uniref:PDS5 cohesin associated factor A n=2 Tax=Tetraodon nigroviridis TaxID=99883 RepID=H3CHW7_TETNG
MEFPQQQKAAGEGKIIYPPGVKEITDKISNDEVVKRLKMVVKTYMDMDQDSEEEKQQYLGLALHLASEFFLRNPNKDVRLLVACCLADIFRIYAPEAPYTSHDKLKEIFLFITRQLKGLEDTKSPQFNRYFYLLENLTWVKSYNICFELEDCNEIFIQLFKTLFSVINNSHNQKVQMHMMDLMSSIIMEGDGVTQELLDTILINLIPAHKNLNKQAYDLAKTLLKRTVQTIETCIANFFNQVLVMGKSSVSDLSEHVFDLIQELFAIDPMLLTSVMPQLEFKLKSNDGEERLAVVRLLAKLFGAKDSELASQNRPLWQCFLGRFNDIHVPVRLECVKFASHCLMNHPDLARDLTEYLKVRSHDPEEAIRHDVIVTIINAGKKDLNLVDDQLLGFVRDRTLDKRWRVRKEAMMGLAQLYKKYCLHHEAGKESAQKISWIKDKLLHIYYQNSIDDKTLYFLKQKNPDEYCLTRSSNKKSPFNRLKTTFKGRLRKETEPRKPKTTFYELVLNSESRNVSFLSSEYSFIIVECIKIKIDNIIVYFYNRASPNSNPSVMLQSDIEILNCKDLVSPLIKSFLCLQVQAIKLLVRWLLGMKNNQSKSANSTLRLLSAMLVSEGDLTEQKKISKSDMSRLRLAAGGAILKLAQEPCYHDIITPEQFQLCGLVINDECYQVRQIFAQKLHLALVKLLLPLEYLAVFALCAKDPVKERRAHARQCLLKNISVRREYIKQNPLAQEKLVSLLPEYVVPYMIHLLAHDPDFTKPQEYDQLKDIKEYCDRFYKKIVLGPSEMIHKVLLVFSLLCVVSPSQKLYIVCDVALFVIANKSTACHLDSPKEPVLPSKFFLLQDKDFKNDKEYLSTEMRQLLLTGKPKPAPVLAAVNKPITVPGKRVFPKTTAPSNTVTNSSTNSSPLSASTVKKNSNDTTESSAQENNENPIIKNEVKKVKLLYLSSEGFPRLNQVEPSQNAAPKAETETPPVKRRGRPPKSAAAASGTAEKGTPTSGAGRGRKRAADSNSPADSVNSKVSKQKSEEGAKRQIDLQR